MHRGMGMGNQNQEPGTKRHVISQLSSQETCGKKTACTYAHSLPRSSCFPNICCDRPPPPTAFAHKCRSMECIGQFLRGSWASLGFTPSGPHTEWLRPVPVSCFKHPHLTEAGAVETLSPPLPAQEV